MLFLNAGIYARLAAHEALSKLRGSPTTSQLEARLRPTLFPTERLSDADSWSVNMRLLAWLRSAYLSSLPESQAALPAARAERSHRLQHLDSAEAPSMAAARAIFGLSHPTGSLRSPALSRAIERASRAAATASDEPGPDRRDRATQELPFGELLELCGGLVSKRGAFAACCEDSGSYELVTKELVDELAAHIAQRATEGSDARLTRGVAGNAYASSAAAAADAAAAVAAAEASEEAADAVGLLDWSAPSDEGSATGAAPSPPDPAADSPPADHTHTFRVLEAGAGNGELAHYLRRALHERGVPVSFIACDDGSWPLPRSASGKPFGRVERMGHRMALRTYRPHLVLVSWMPMGVDWTADFRACESVSEYVLLGECYDGAAGHNWLTWGNPAFAPPRVTQLGQGDASHDVDVAPYAADGWVAEELRDVSRWMLSRFSSDVADCECNSSAIAFRRQPEQGVRETAA